MRMLGKRDKPPCGNCCGDPTHAAQRVAKGRERTAVQHEIATGILEWADERPAYPVPQVDFVDEAQGWDYR